MRIVVVSLLMLLLNACGGGGSSASRKALFSSWKADNSAMVLNLTNAEFGVAQSISFLFAGGELCSCLFSVVGTDALGNYTAASCTYLAGSGSGTDPGCASANDNGTYSNDDAKLTVCSSVNSTCDTYH